MDIFEQMQMTLARLDSQPDPRPVRWLAGEEAGWRSGHLQQLQSALGQLECGNLQEFQHRVAGVHQQVQSSLAILASPDLLMALADHPETDAEFQAASELIEELNLSLSALSQSQNLQEARHSLAWFSEVLADVDSLQQNLVDQLQSGL